MNPLVLSICICAVLLSMAVVAVRGYAGPTMFDRILAANLFGTYSVVLITLMGLLMQEPTYVDIALLYTLINFVTTIAFLKYFTHCNLGAE